MRRRSPSELQARASYLDFARRIDPNNRVNPPTSGPIWQYWNSGRDTAPDIVRQCFDSVVRWTSGREHHVLSAATVADFIELPPWITKKIDSIGQTHFSDILRAYLLSSRGGTWIDATVFISGPIDHLINVPYFAFSRPNDPYLLSSWFMHSSQGHPIPLALAEMLSLYWEERDSLQDYFTIHYMFECGLTLHRELRSAWLQAPLHWADKPHWLQLNFGASPPDETLQEILKNTSVHKLTWKFDREYTTILLKCLDRVQSLASG